MHNHMLYVRYTAQNDGEIVRLFGYQETRMPGKIVLVCDKMGCGAQE